MIKELLTKLEPLHLRFMALPETLFLLTEKEGVNDKLLRIVDDIKTPLLVGVEAESAGDGVRNRVLFFEQDAAVAHYDKRSLVP
ncbi:MAG: hypothetical protein CMH60_05600, partial [Myxococcales bacterium]|nr:hypothetical protein [Myxococcales bacterium]